MDTVTDQRQQQLETLSLDMLAALKEGKDLLDHQQPAMIKAVIQADSRYQKLADLIRRAEGVL